MDFKEIFVRSVSYLTDLSVEKRISDFSGEVEVRWVNGHKVLDSPHANYSFGSLHRLFQLVFRRIDLAHNPPGQILLLGMGAGSVIHILRKELKLDPKIVAVEIDPAVISIARKHFNIDLYKDVDINCCDAAQFINSEQRRFDLIVIDLFLDQEVPEQFTREPFIGDVLKRLTDRGRVIYNFITKTKKQQEALNGLLDTLHYHPISITRHRFFSNTVLILDLNSIIRNS